MEKSQVINGLKSFFIETVLSPNSGRKNEVLVGIDECLNMEPIFKLARKLIEVDLAQSSRPMWQELRVTEGGVITSFVGGVDRDSAFRHKGHPFGSVGIPVKHQSWSDFQVAQLIACELILRKKVIFLTANLRMDDMGIRYLLKNHVAPILEKNEQELTIHAFYKKGKTKIDDFCELVYRETAKKEHRTGYIESLV